MIDLRNIETFYWAATLGSFRAAADKLNTTQPAISQRIALLEEDLGVKLFDRGARGTTLTAKGQELLSHAERMLQTRHEMQMAARTENSMSGTLRLGVSESIVHTWLADLMQFLHRRYPALMLDIEVETTPILKTQLLASKLDVAIMLGPVQEHLVENLELCEYPVHWVASPKLRLGSKPISLKTLAQWPVITYGTSTAPNQSLRQVFRRQGIALPPIYASASLSVIQRLALDGLGTAVIAPVTVRQQIENGELQRLNVRAVTLPPLHYTACWISGPDSQMARIVAHAARDIAAGYDTQQGVLRDVP